MKAVLGALFLLVAIRQWRSRPHEGDEAAAPKWMGAIDSFGPGKALGAGVLLVGVNPKNLLLAVGAAATIAQTGISGSQQAVAYAVFALIGTLGVGAPVVLLLALGDRMAVLCLVIGAKLIGDAISGLST